MFLEYSGADRDFQATEHPRNLRLGLAASRSSLAAEASVILQGIFGIQALLTASRHWAQNGAYCIEQRSRRTLDTTAVELYSPLRNLGI